MSHIEQFQRFKAYMEAPFHELSERDSGRNDPHRLAFAEWGVPQGFLLWMWQAAEQASRRAALEEAWEAVHGERLEAPTETHGDMAYEHAVEDCEHAIRLLIAKETDNG